MQNIKYCSSCNKTFTDSSISFCPFDGNVLVEMQPVRTHQQQQPILTQPLLNNRTLPRKQNINWKSLIPALLPLIAVIMCCNFCSNPRDSVTKNGNTAATNISKPSAAESTVPNAPPIPNQVEQIDPAIIKSRAAKGEQIYKRITAKYGLPVMFGWQAKNISLLIPIKEWNSLSKQDQVNLTYYAEDFVREIASNPKPYVDKWAQYVKAIEGESFQYDNLTPQSFHSQVSGLCSSCWQITTGTLKGREFYEETTPVTGGNAEAFRQQEKEIAKTDKEEDAEESIDFAASMSAGEHLAQAKAALNSGYDPQNEHFGNTILAREHIKAIRSNAAEHKEAQELLKAVVKRERERKDFQDAVVKEVMRMAN